MMTTAGTVEGRRRAAGAIWCWVVVLALLAMAVRGRHLAAIDLELMQWIQTLRVPWLDAAARRITFFGSSPWTLGVMVVMSLRWRRPRTTLIALWATWLAGLLLQVALRYGVAQWRPDAGALPLAMDLRTRFELAGFTSGHAFRSAFVYGWLAERAAARPSFRARLTVFGCGIMVALVGASRLYLSRHWFTDVLGGWIVACAALAVARRWA